MEQATFTKEQVEHAIMTNAEQTEKAILALYKRQTTEEKLEHVSFKRNKIGFNATDASIGSNLARWLLTGKHFTDAQLNVARRMLKKYVKQLTRIANGK